MCGRFVSARPAADLADWLEAVDDTSGELPASWNVATTDPVPVVLAAPPAARRLVAARWGLLPWWAGRSPSAGRPLINARAETAARSRAFAQAVRRRRCLVPADGWYEWAPDPTGAGKQVHYLTPADGSPLVFAGLYETAGDQVSCAIVTRAAPAQIARLHDRMPVLLPPAAWQTWLDPTIESAGHLLAGDAAGEQVIELVGGLELRRVGPAVGNVRLNGPELVAPLRTVPQQPLQ